MSRTPWQAAVEALEAEGVEYAFGLSGEPAAPRRRPARHLREADPGAERVERGLHGLRLRPRRPARPGIFFGNPGPGTTNMVSGLLEADSACVPVIGDVERHCHAPRRRRRAAGARRADADAAGHQVVGEALQPGADAVDHAARVPRLSQTAGPARCSLGAAGRPRPHRGGDGSPTGRPGRACARARRRTPIEALAEALQALAAPRDRGRLGRLERRCRRRIAGGGGADRRRRSSRRPAAAAASR